LRHGSGVRRFLVATAVLALVSSSAMTALAADVPLDVTRFRIVKRDSGPVDYTSRRVENGVPILRASYRPPLETVVHGFQVADADRAAARAVRWSWRAIMLPKGGDECAKGKEDSAAVVYLTWKRGLRWYTLKYVWSAVGRLGAVCDTHRNPFLAQDTIILETGGPAGVWKDERIDLRAAFREHFEGGDRTAEVPDFVGIGVMSDGDQTQSESAADYARFVLER
jgi:hypothetical protein